MVVVRGVETFPVHLSETRVSWNPMQCEERDRLLDLFLVAIASHSDALRATIGSGGEALRCARKLVASAEATCADCREVLEAHEREHGCV